MDELSSQMILIFLKRFMPIEMQYLQNQGRMGMVFLLLMSLMLAQGCGDVAAVRWYGLAADLGNASAQYSLGIMYHYGLGVVQDYVQAHKWYNLAAAHSTESDRNQAVESRAAVEAEILPAQVAEAEKMAQEWRPKRGNPGL